MADQQTFNPIDYTFKWTSDWYEWDYTEAHKLALKARNAEARRLRRASRKVYVQTLKAQRISRGGIGSNHPHIEQIVNVYMLNVAQS